MWAADDLELIKLKSKDSSRMLLKCQWETQHVTLQTNCHLGWSGEDELGLDISVTLICQWTPHDTLCITIPEHKLHFLSRKRICHIWVLDLKEKFILQLSHYSLNPNIRHTLCRTNQTPSPHNSGEADTCTVFLIPWQNSFLKLQHSTAGNRVRNENLHSRLGIIATAEEGTA